MFSGESLAVKLQFTNHIFFRTAVLRKLFDIRFSYNHCNFSRVCLLVKMALKTVTRSILLTALRSKIDALLRNAYGGDFIHSMLLMNSSFWHNYCTSGNWVCSLPLTRQNRQLNIIVICLSYCLQKRQQEIIQKCLSLLGSDKSQRELDLSVFSESFICFSSH